MKDQSLPPLEAREASEKPNADTVLAAAQSWARLPDAERSVAAQAEILRSWRNLDPDSRALTRKALANALSMSVGDLRATTCDAATRDGAESPVREHEPWPEPVDGGALLEEVAGFLARHVSLPPHAAVAEALWSVQTHGTVRGLFDFAGYLNLSSPVPRCGKTTNLELLSRLCARPVSTSSVTNAAAFRIIHEHRPTMLVDEADKIFADHGGKNDLIGTINAGHRCDGTTTRCVGDSYSVQSFRCFAPYVLAGIKDLPDTLKDRSIVIRMQRRRPGERLDRRTPETSKYAWELGRRAAGFVEGNLDALRTAALAAPRPEALDDRACDIWGPLFAVAAVAGGPWPNRAIEAALALSGSRDESDPDLGVLLLTDLLGIWESDIEGRNNLTTEYLLLELRKLPERPWATWAHGQGLNDRWLAKLLRPFGVSSTTVRSGDERAKGYRRADLEGPWASYVPDRAPDNASQPRPKGDSVTTAWNPREGRDRDGDVCRDVTDLDSPTARRPGNCHAVTVDEAPALPDDTEGPVDETDEGVLL